MEAHTPAVQVPRPAFLQRFNLGRVRDYGVVIALVALFLVLSVSSNAFLTERNLLNIAQQWAPVGLMALGGTIVIIAGGFDLSVGAIYVVAGVISAKVANATSAEIGILAGLGAGLAFGLINGLLVTIGRLNHFVATIGTLIVYSGLAVAISGGFVIAVSDPNFGWLGETKLLNAKLSVWILLLAVVLCSFLLARTPFGRRARAVGGNIEAARLSGVRTHVILASTYVISGLSGGLAAVLVASQSLSASANTSSGVEFAVWTAILVGGNSLNGGEGAISRTIVGVCLLALIANGFNLLGVNPTYQQMVTGGILLASVGLDAWIRSRRA